MNAISFQYMVTRWRVVPLFVFSLSVAFLFAVLLPTFQRAQREPPAVPMPRFLEGLWMSKPTACNDLYEEIFAVYARYTEEESPFPSEKVFGLLVDAARARDCSIVTLPFLYKEDGSIADLVPFFKDLLRELQQLRESSVNAPQVLDVHEAMAIFGWRVATAKIDDPIHRLMMLLQGVGITAGSIEGLKEIYRSKEDQTRVEAVDEYLGQLRSVVQKVKALR